MQQLPAVRCEARVDTGMDADQRALALLTPVRVEQGQLRIRLASPAGTVFMVADVPQDVVDSLRRRASGIESAEERRLFIQEWIRANTESMVAGWMDSETESGRFVFRMSDPEHMRFVPMLAVTPERLAAARDMAEEMVRLSRDPYIHSAAPPYLTEASRDMAALLRRMQGQPTQDQIRDFNDLYARCSSLRDRSIADIRLSFGRAQGGLEAAIGAAEGHLPELDALAAVSGRESERASRLARDIRSAAEAGRREAQVHGRLSTFTERLVSLGSAAAQLLARHPASPAVRPGTEEPAAVAAEGQRQEAQALATRLRELAGNEHLRGTGLARGAIEVADAMDAELGRSAPRREQLARLVSSADGTAMQMQSIIDEFAEEARAASEAEAARQRESGPRREAREMVERLRGFVASEHVSESLERNADALADRIEAELRRETLRADNLSALMERARGAVPRLQSAVDAGRARVDAEAAEATEAAALARTAQERVATINGLLDESGIIAANRRRATAVIGRLETARARRRRGDLEAGILAADEVIEALRADASAEAERQRAGARPPVAPEPTAGEIPAGLGARQAPGEVELTSQRVPVLVILAQERITVLDGFVTQMNGRGPQDERDFIIGMIRDLQRYGGTQGAGGELRSAISSGQMRRLVDAIRASDEVIARADAGLVRVRERRASRDAAAAQVRAAEDARRLAAEREEQQRIEDIRRRGGVPADWVIPRSWEGYSWEVSRAYIDRFRSESRASPEQTEANLAIITGRSQPLLSYAGEYAAPNAGQPAQSRAADLQFGTGEQRITLRVVLTDRDVLAACGRLGIRYDAADENAAIELLGNARHRPRIEAELVRRYQEIARQYYGHVDAAPPRDLNARISEAVRTLIGNATTPIQMEAVGVSAGPAGPATRPGPVPALQMLRPEVTGGDGTARSPFVVRVPVPATGGTVGETLYESDPISINVSFSRGSSRHDESARFLLVFVGTAFNPAVQLEHVSAGELAYSAASVVRSRFLQYVRDAGRVQRPSLGELSSISPERMRATIEAAGRRSATVRDYFQAR